MPRHGTNLGASLRLLEKRPAEQQLRLKEARLAALRILVCTAVDLKLHLGLDGPIKLVENQLQVGVGLCLHLQHVKVRKVLRRGGWRELVGLDRCQASFGSRAVGTARDEDRRRVQRGARLRVHVVVLQRADALTGGGGGRMLPRRFGGATAHPGAQASTYVS